MHIDIGDLVVLFLIIMISILVGYGMGVAKIKDEKSDDYVEMEEPKGPDLTKGDHI